MIQSSYNQPIAPKALPEVKSKPKSEAKPDSADRALDDKNFESELKSAEKSTDKPNEKKVDKKTEQTAAKSSSEKLESKEEKTDSNISEVKSVLVPSEMKLEKPSNLLKAENVQGQPKVFDSSLTETVEDILQPKNAEVTPVKITDEQVLKLAQGEIIDFDGEIKLKEQVATGVLAGLNTESEEPVSQAMLKTPQIQSGRSPAIEFAQSEIDPQLLGNEDFVAQKNLVAKKNMTTSAYGINKPQAQKIALENGLNQTQVIKEVGSAEASGQGPLNSQQFILNMQNETSTTPTLNGAEHTQKVFDMSNIKSGNSSEIMDQISNYIIQAKASKETTVTARVDHKDLGLIDITVQKSVIPGQDAVSINIATHSLDGKNFFQLNSKDLVSHLTSSGINVSDMKLETSSSSKNSFDMNQQQSGRQGSQEKQFGSEQNQRRHDSDRRQDLWKLLTDKEAA